MQYPEALGRYRTARHKVKRESGGTRGVPPGIWYQSRTSLAEAVAPEASVEMTMYDPTGTLEPD